jgi:large subunit ribosomal protein L13
MTTHAVKRKEIERNWLLVDADGKVLGRLASKVAIILRGKHKPNYTPNMDSGDFVIVINAARVHLTGTKLDKKKYYRTSGYTGGLKDVTAKKLMEKSPETLIMQAVSGMLPKTRLRAPMLKKLKVYAGPDHPHQAQQPRSIEI